MGGRRIFKSARILPLEMHSETVIVILLAFLLSLDLGCLHENRDWWWSESLRPHMVAYGCLASQGSGA